MLEHTNPLLNISFLREFTKEIILSKYNQIQTQIQEGERAEKTRKNIQIHKLKQKIFERPETFFRTNINLQQPVQRTNSPLLRPILSKKVLEIAKPLPRVRSLIRKPVRRNISLPPSFPPKQMQIQEKELPKIEETITPAQAIQGYYQPTQGEELSSLPTGKINSILKDKSITTIECSGPGKPILVKKAGEVKMTRISLTEEEIKEIIDFFSQKARIPIVGGLLRAAAGNLTISAITSEFIGGRFIINKASPYSFIE